MILMTAWHFTVSCFLWLCDSNHRRMAIGTTQKFLSMSSVLSKLTKTQMDDDLIERASDILNKFNQSLTPVDRRYAASLVSAIDYGPLKKLGIGIHDNKYKLSYGNLAGEWDANNGGVGIEFKVPI